MLSLRVAKIIDTIHYDTGLEASFTHSLHAVYLCKFTHHCLLCLTFEPEPMLQVQVGKFRPTKCLLVALQVLIINAYEGHKLILQLGKCFK